MQMLLKSLAATLLALPAAISITGALALLAPGSLHARTLPALMLFFPIWIAAITLSFVPRTGLRAISWLSAMTILGFAAQWLAKASHWVLLPT